MLPMYLNGVVFMESDNTTDYKYLYLWNSCFKKKKKIVEGGDVALIEYTFAVRINAYA
jgi:hypothetical protein